MSPEIIQPIAIGGLAAGVVIGLAVQFFASAAVRAKVQAECLRFGSGGALFLLVWWFAAPGSASAPAEIAIGVIVFASVVAGIVLWLAGRMKQG